MPPTKPLSQGEFIALMAVLFATVAFTIDAMLPALPAIAAELTPASPNRAQLIVTSFVVGLGLGSFVAGPLSDALGRRPVIVGGALLYCTASLLASISESLEAVLLARVVQGLGAAGPRIVSVAILRDLYSGRQMARIMSFAMMIFTLVPAAAPLAGQGIIALTGWRGVFRAFVVFAAFSTLWLYLRQPETLPPPARTPLRAGALARAAREVLSHPVVQVATLTQALLFGTLFAALSSIQPLFAETFGRPDSFPLWFAGIALTSGMASLVNARLVVRVGMRRMIRRTLEVQIAVSGAMLFAFLTNILPQAVAFPAFLVWITSVFFIAGLTFGNLNAVAMEPMGHVAGMAASVISSLATVGGALVAAPIGLAFDGTPVPLAAGVVATVLAARLLMRRLPG